LLDRRPQIVLVGFARSSDRFGDCFEQQDLTQQSADLGRSWTRQNNSHALQEKLTSLAQQSVQEVARAKASEAKANDLTHLLQDRAAARAAGQLSLTIVTSGSDGRRDLYIAEVYDVARSGETRNLWTSVLYTRESLISMLTISTTAEAKKAIPFSWGRRGRTGNSGNLGVSLKIMRRNDGF